MIKTSVLRYAAIGMATISMAGFAAASTVTFDTTGADSNQQVHLNNSNHLSSSNYNNVGVANFSGQDAQSGHVSADKNTSLSGNVGSGNVSNDHSSSTGVTLTNSSMGAGLGAWAASDPTNVTMSTTGADSNNTVSVDNHNSVEMRNTNTVQVENISMQSGKSGSVSADKNTTVGGLKSGDVSNHDSSVTNISLGN